jgi:hypothetical protein
MNRLIPPETMNLEIFTRLDVERHGEEHKVGAAPSRRHARRGILSAIQCRNF